MSSQICPKCESSDIIYRFSTREYECRNCGHVFAAPYDDRIMKKISAKTAVEISTQAREKTANIEKRYASAKSTGRCPTCKSALRNLAGGAFFCEKCHEVIAPATFDPSIPLGTASPSGDNTTDQYEKYYESRTDRGKEP